MNERTIQEAFNHIYINLAKQGRAANFTSPCDGVFEDVCALRVNNTLNGVVLKCAIGWLIPDEVYSPKLEGLMLNELQRTIPDILGMLPYLFLHDVRFSHDHNTSCIDDMLASLRQVAEKHRLTVPEITSS